MRFMPIIAGCLFLSVGLTGCVAPYNDARREAGQREPVGQSQKGRVAICYHPWRDTEITAQSTAQEICATTGKRAVLQEVKHFNCSFTAPHTALFTCE